MRTEFENAPWCIRCKMNCSEIMCGSAPVQKHCSKMEIIVHAKKHRATGGTTSEFIAARPCLDHNEFNEQALNAAH